MRHLRNSTNESVEQRWETISGERGGKAADQGEHSSAQHVLDTERDSRVPGVGGCAPSSEGKAGDEVHRFAPPCDGRTAPGKLLRFEAKSRTGRGRRYVAGV